MKLTKFSLQNVTFEIPGLEPEEDLRLSSCDLKIYKVLISIVKLLNTKKLIVLGNVCAEK